MTNFSGTTPDGRRLGARASHQDAGECADCGKHVDPGDPALYTRLTQTGLEPRTDERGLRDDEELASRGTSSSMGGETIDDSPGCAWSKTRAPGDENSQDEDDAPLNADAASWDGSCYHCGASADRVGKLAE